MATADGGKDISSLYQSCRHSHSVGGSNEKNSAER